MIKKSTQFLIIDPETFIFESREEALKAIKAHKESRFKSFKSRSDALKFVRNGIQVQQAISGNNSNNSPPSNYDLLKCK